MEEAIADPYRRAFNWYDGHIGENPQDAIERRETREEMLAAMTDKQREVFIMYYRDAMTQEQIAAVIGVTKQSVSARLFAAPKFGFGQNVCTSRENAMVRHKPDKMHHTR